MSADQLPHLETFAKAAELSCFTAAARSLGLTQAAISQRIQTLERDIGVPLFRRQGGRAFLTDAGRSLYVYSQRILALHAEARQAVTGQAQPAVGDLTLAASSVPGEHLLPAVLPGFQQRHPHVQVRVTVTDSRDVMDQIERGKAHLGLVGGKSDRPHLEFRAFACDEMVLVVPAGHTLVGRKRASLQELCKQPLIVREAGSGSRWCLEEALAKAGKSINDLHIVLELGSNEAIKEAVRRGLGTAVLSSQVIEQEDEAGVLHGLRVTGLALKRQMFLVWDRRRVLPIPARLLLDYLVPDPHVGQDP